MSINFDIWRKFIASKHQQIRQLQTTKLIELHSILKKNNFSDVEGALIHPAHLLNPAVENSVYIAKCLNYVYLTNYLQFRSILEIGFNWGYSASLLLESEPTARLHSVDICQHWYTPLCGKVLEDLYGSRFSSTWEASDIAFQQIIKSGATFDFIIIDGGHEYRTAESDILSAIEILNDGGVILVDDTDSPNVRAAVLATLNDNQGFVQLTPENFGLFEYQLQGAACYDQMIYLKKSSHLKL